METYLNKLILIIIFIFPSSIKRMLFGFKNSDLPQFNLENIEVLINKNLIEKKLIKPLYLS